MSHPDQMSAGATAARAETLPARILRLLQAGHSPLTGVQLTEALAAEGHAVQLSAVFRALSALTARGKIRKIVLASAYAPVGKGFAIPLLCRECGAVQEVDGSPIRDALVRRSGAAGFVASHCIVEVPGTCPRCQAEPPGGRASTRKAQRRR